MHVPTKTCPQCGAGIRENDAHCPDCGAALHMSQAKAPAHTGSHAAAPPPIPTQAKLPPELADLHAPKPSQPLEASGCTLFFFLAWTLFSALFLVIGVGTYLRDSSAYHRLSREGLPAVAVITELDFDSDEDSIRYYVAYHFQASFEGATTRFQGLDNVSSALFSRLEVGQPLEILYWPADPSLSAVKAELQPPS
ncbi:MAG: DUF3592 domain-containing protein, partial [Chloroflexia bacterium]|nr:DUF3592 domain-containing protein [Chloroflexia bacterium]